MKTNKEKQKERKRERVRQVERERMFPVACKNYCFPTQKAYILKTKIQGLA